MIVATIDILPASGEQRRTLATLEIANVGGNDNWGNYHCKLYRSETISPQTATIIGFERGRGAVALVAEALKELDP